MRSLALHHQRMREKHPEEDLLILFDIDGTIVDVRYKIYYLLRAYDRAHGTLFFQGLRPEDVTCHENQLEDFLRAAHCPRTQVPRIIEWYLRHRSNPSAVMAAHRPYRGVMEVIRWFQIQPRTHVGINTGTPEAYREETLRMMNEIGKAYMVRFPSELLYMNPRGWEEGVRESKVEGVRYFRQRGYRVIAVVDNVPEYLEAIAEIDEEGEILLLRAEMILKTARSLPLANVAAGEEYDITELIEEKDLPRHVQFVWHGINDEVNLRQFLSSRIQWAEFDVRLDEEGNMILRHDSIEERPPEVGEKLLQLEDVLDRLAPFGKGVKLDFKEGGRLVEEVTALVRSKSWPVERLWLNGDIPTLGEEGIRKLARSFPGAVIQCPVDFLAGLVRVLPEHGRQLLEMLRSWGVTRFSVSWQVYKLPEFVERVIGWGYEVNIYNVPDLEGFLKAVLLQPTSITSDFNFPKWHYYGRGSGERARRHEYELHHEGDERR